ncbi:MAG TPA: hypothetical protein VFI11_00805, partial [Anaerolineales bacterium]|nr:hypothetical protein [Anaerolineales bacterium]
NLASSDLWMADYPVGTVSTIVAEDTVVEAQWAPDGQALAYILATPTRYELHWRTLDGEDRIIATDLAPTWSIAPTGDLVAFTRESGYELVGAPGLYVVPVTGGAEVKLADVDRHGAGSIDDRPQWSFDGKHVALGYFTEGTLPFGLVIAASDGSSSHSVTYAPDVDADIAGGGVPMNVWWHPDGRSLVGLGGTVVTMGGPQDAVVFELDDSLSQIVSATSFGTVAAIIDWAIPGEAVWVLAESGELVALSLP